MQTGGPDGRGWHLLDRDEGHLHPHPHLAASWQRRGQPPRIPAAGVNQRATMFGAREDRTGPLSRLIVPNASSATCATFVAQGVNQGQDAPIGRVMDNASSHKSAPLRHGRRDHTGHVDVRWRPTSSPTLNVSDRVWRLLKPHLACHRRWHDQPDLIACALSLRDRIRARCGAPAYPHITLAHDV